jgi:hypothetical protein
MEKEKMKAVAPHEKQDKKKRNGRENTYYDALDEALAETFPASDAPAWMGSAIAGADGEKSRKV